MKAITDVLGAKLRPKGARMAILQVLGFGVIALGAAMIFAPAGVIAAGVSLVVLAGLQE